MEVNMKIKYNMYDCKLNNNIILYDLKEIKVLNIELNKIKNCKDKNLPND